MSSMEIKNWHAYLWDCFEVMDLLIEQWVKVDAIITDPPYWTTACKWDQVIPFDKMWDRLNKLIKPNGAIVLFGSEPFSSALRMSNIKNYKYDWIWKKNAGSNFATVKYQPMKEHEIVSIFSLGKTNYYPIMQERSEGWKIAIKRPIASNTTKKEWVYWVMDMWKKILRSELRVPSSVQFFNRERWLHPTQKPVALIEYLVRTYTNEWETVLDFTAWSFTTAVACENTNRKWICIEKDENYFNIWTQRLWVVHDDKHFQMGVK